MSKPYKRFANNSGPSLDQVGRSRPFDNGCGPYRPARDTKVIVRGTRTAQAKPVSKLTYKALRYNRVAASVRVAAPSTWSIVN